MHGSFEICLIRLGVCIAFFVSFFSSSEGREDFSALRIKMQDDKPSAAGHALPRSSAKLRVSICERETGGYGEAVASTSYTSVGYRLFLMQRSRGAFRQSFAYNRFATDLWIFIYCEKRVTFRSVISKVERWKRDTNIYVPSTSFLILEDISRISLERGELAAYSLQKSDQDRSFTFSWSESWRNSVKKARKDVII